nr:phosphoribosylanthranilate isomerase [Actinomycetota bacterium]
PEQCAQVPVPVVKAVHAAGENAREAFEAALENYRGFAVGLLVDTYDADALGGTGRTFDWEALGSLAGAPVPVFVAGGLNPDNVADAIRTLRPYAVDVSSGVEVEPGRKDADAIRAFVKAVRAIDQEVPS